MAMALQGHKLLGVERKGKYFYLVLDNEGPWPVLHFGGAFLTPRADGVAKCPTETQHPSDTCAGMNGGIAVQGLKSVQYKRWVLQTEFFQTPSNRRRLQALGTPDGTIA
jgi:hypothetical protein